MSRLTVYADTAPGDPLLETEDGVRIAQVLAAVRVDFERRPLAAPLAPDDDGAAVLDRYRDEVGRLTAAGGYQSVDAIRVRPDHPQAAEMRGKFFAEHLHHDDEVRFFVEGSAMFYLRADGRLHMMLCEAGDLISVPAGMRHWFDMGPRPSFAAIRLFTVPDGWVADFTGDPIATNFPTYEPAA